MRGSGIGAGETERRVPTPMSYRGNRGGRRFRPCARTCGRPATTLSAPRAMAQGSGSATGVAWRFGRKTPPGEGRFRPDVTRENSREARRGGQRRGAAQHSAKGRRSRVRLPDTPSGSPVLGRARCARRRGPLGSARWRDRSPTPPCDESVVRTVPAGSALDRVAMRLFGAEFARLLAAPRDDECSPGEMKHAHTGTCALRCPVNGRGTDSESGD